jgi:hypothetical protein
MRIDVVVRMPVRLAPELGRVRGCTGGGTRTCLFPCIKGLRQPERVEGMIREIYSRSFFDHRKVLLDIRALLGGVDG